MTSRLGPVAIISAGSTVWRTSVPLPAVPMTKRYSPGRTALGLKVSAVELSEAPSVSAAPTSVAARTAVKMLAQQPRPLPPRTDVLDQEWLTGRQRKAERRAQNLTAAFSERSIDPNYDENRTSFPVILSHRLPAAACERSPPDPPARPSLHRSACMPPESHQSPPRPSGTLRPPSSGHDLPA